MSGTHAARRRWRGAAASATLLLAVLAGAAGEPRRVEVPDVIRLGAATLGPHRVLESEPIRVRLPRLESPSVLRLVLETPDERWRGAEVTFTTRGGRHGTGLAGPLAPGVPTEVLRAGPAPAGAEAEIVLRIRAPARRLGAGPRALRLTWQLAEDPAGFLATLDGRSSRTAERPRWRSESPPDPASPPPPKGRAAPGTVLEAVRPP